LWTKNTLDQVGGHEVGDDGLFWMSLKDYKKYYAYTIVCKYESDFIYSSRKIVEKTKFVV